MSNSPSARWTREHGRKRVYAQASDADAEAVKLTGQEAFREVLLNVLTGKCACGRARNKQGVWCCRMCREDYGTHSRLCRKRNGS